MSHHKHYHHHHHPHQRDILHVICMITNPVGYKSRVRLYKEFAEYMSKFPNVVLWTVEGIYPGSKFEVTIEGHPHHHRVELVDELWHKENLLNVLVDRKLSVDVPDWENVAWIDADVMFARPDWAQATLDKLREHPVVQMFSECMDLNSHCETIGSGMDSGVMGGAIRKWHHNAMKPTDGDTRFAGHYGYAWAATRQAWDTMGGLLEVSVIGSADYLMVHGLLGDMRHCINPKYTQGYKTACLEWGVRARMAVAHQPVGYVRGLLMHHWHGPKNKRGYSDRQRILDQHRYDPKRDLVYQRNGALRWFVENPEHSTALHEEMQRYFRSRDEDALSNP
jgi:hypothetical protein